MIALGAKEWRFPSAHKTRKAQSEIIVRLAPKTDRRADIPDRQLRAKCRQSTRSLDHLIGNHEQIVRYGQAKCLCCPQIDDHLEFGGLHDR